LALKEIIMSEIFLDVETQRLQTEVPGGWDNIAAFGLALAVTWDDAAGFRTWCEPDAAALVQELARFPLVVGYNVLRFDYTVLSAYQPTVHTLLKGKTVDMLVDLYSRLGFRPPLQSVAQATLGRSKAGDGLAAVRWFRAGEIDKVAAYCQQDVAITRDVFYHGRRQGHVLYLDRGRPAKVMVRW
jgi:DEAD/DEAH box helicase domain-containing protein